ncbi:MAG: hypothetical protein U9Q78_01665 [Chloroflexota bacterium]|nr:hypothetical protein [Chloroflexota bacterium]
MNLREMGLNLLPISIKAGGDISDLPVLATKTWVHGPPKPRDLLRAEEIPEEDVSLDKISQSLPFVRVLPMMEVQGLEDVGKIPLDEADALIIRGGWGGKYSGERQVILNELADLGKPILPSWDPFGYTWGRGGLNFGLEGYAPFSATEVKSLLRALRGWKALRELKALYIGERPPSMTRPLDFADIQRHFGSLLFRRPFTEYKEAIANVHDDQAEALAAEWKEKYQILDEREQNLVNLAKVYLALKWMLAQSGANGLTVDCAFLPDVDLAPCFAFSLLIDEGFPCGCEADTGAHLTMVGLMGISGGPALMGNHWSNITHADVEDNIIVINHDVVPPSMGCQGCKLCLRDFHESGKGLTGYVELEKGQAVTVARLSDISMEAWATVGEVMWTQDTAHCRTSIGIRVPDAKQAFRCAVTDLEEHQVVAYGDYRDELSILYRMLDLEFEIL